MKSADCDSFDLHFDAHGKSCDLIACSPHVNLRYRRDAEKYLEEDIRIDMDGFRRMDAGIFEAYTAVGKKADSIRTLIKLLKK